MTTYNTKNPVPSADARDRYDNSQVFDELMNGPAPRTPDRLGILRQSWAGIEADFLGSQTTRAAAFQAFLDAIGWSSLGAYAAGISIVSHTQTIDYAGQPYQLKPSVPASIDAPYVTTGVWAAEGVNFKLVGDNSLRQDLAAPSGGKNIGGVAVVVDSVVALLDASPREDQAYLTKSYHPGWAILTTPPRGGESYAYDPSMPKARHNGGDVISTTSTWDGSIASLPDFLNNAGDTDAGGSGCFVSINSAESVHIDRFGALPNNPAANRSNYASIRSALKSAIYHSPIQLDGQREIHAGSGTYAITGMSPLSLTRTEMEALPGGYRYVRGLKWQGTGMRSTYFQLVSPNDGTGESWFYNTYDANYPNDSSVQDFIEFSGISFKGAEADYTLPPNQKTSGFRFITFGWEKFMRFNDCSFDYMDTMFSLEGNGNADHNKWFGCSFTRVRDKCFYFNNNQSVANIFVGCDMEEVHGKGFLVGPKGGGDVTWIGGSVILYPELSAPNTPRVPQNNSAFIYFDNSGVNSGQTAGANNGNFTFFRVRFETYEAKQHFVFSYRSDENAYGSLRVNFDHCIMVDPHNFSGGNDFPSEPYGGVYIENDVVVNFNKCMLRKGYTYTVGKHDGEIVFNEPEYLPASPVSSSDLLASECTIAGNAINAAIICRGMKVNPLLVAGDYTKLMSGDFTKLQGGRLPSFATAQLKDARSPWPQPNISGPLWLYLPGGSLVRSVSIQKPAVAMSAPTANYGLGLTGADGKVLMTPGSGVENRAILSNTVLSELYVVPPAPNNFIQVVASGSSSTETFPNRLGSVYVEYL